MGEHIHFIGVGGIGMSGLAKMLLQRGGVAVSGSDLAMSETVELLEKMGLRFSQGHAAQVLEKSITRVVISSDIPRDNPELVEARRRNIHILHRSDVLSELLRDSKALLVTGTHGKTTTSSLLSHVVVHASVAGALKEPSFAVGGIMKNYMTNAHCSPSSSESYFVAEADESDSTFLKYHPFAAIITNIDTDHLAHYGTIDALKKAFSTFSEKVPKDFLFVCGDCDRAKSAIPFACWYGKKQENDVVVENIVATSNGLFFDLSMKTGERYTSIFVPLYGEHNALNAAAVFTLARRLEIPEKVIRDAFSSFHGVLRRCDMVCADPKSGLIVLDDYAHHPTEIKATLNAVRKAFPQRRMVAVFQPHRPSRIRTVIGEFQNAFHDADVLYFTDLYLASEKAEDVDTISEELRVSILTSHEVTTACHFVKKQELLGTLASAIRPYDVLLFMGAGDITKVAKEFSSSLFDRRVKKYSVAVVYGGMNSENRISCSTAASVWKNLPEAFFEKKAFFIDCAGRWHQTEGITPVDRPSQETFRAQILKELLSCDIAFPALHGPYGEDGALQGFFEILGLPYVGSGHVASSVAMDKAFAKMVAQSVGVPVVPFITLRRQQWKEEKLKCLERIGVFFKQFPIFIKPVHLGSSVGVTKIDLFEACEQVLDELFEIDDKVVVEEGLCDVREIEFAPLGTDDVTVPHPGEILSSGRVYDYAAKYGKNCFKTSYKADISEDVLQKGISYAQKIFQEFGLSGLTRIDFFLTPSDQWYFNEANPLPGFTEISLYPSIWKTEGVSYQELLTSLILYGFQRMREKRRIDTLASRKGQELEVLCVV